MMNTEQEQNTVKPSSKGRREPKIDYGRLVRDVKKHKRLYFIGLPVTFLLAAVISLGIPNYYKCSVELAPELSAARRASALSSLVSSLGMMNLSSNQNGGDAILPNFYPQLINSVSFRASLFPVKIHRNKQDSLMTYYDYLQLGQQKPWWTSAKDALLSLFKSDESDHSEGVNPFQLTKEQAGIAKEIGKKVMCDVDVKTMVINITVIDQDPLIAATMADSVQQRLQDFITDYRTSKARIDVEYYKALSEQAKERYEKALGEYAAFSDANQKIFLESVRSQQSKLANEVEMELRAYTQIVAQLQAAEAKLQEETPAFTTLQAATVPVEKEGPSRARNCLMFAALAAIVFTLYAFYKEDDLAPLILGINKRKKDAV